MDSKSVVDMIEASSGVHFSGFHMDGLETRNTEMGQPTTSAADMFKQPFVIGKYYVKFYCLLMTFGLGYLSSKCLITPIIGIFVKMYIKV